VENAVKHGIACKQAGGEVLIRGRIDGPDNGSRQLVLVVQDSGAGSTEERLARGRELGVGLRNVERRLVMQYGPAATLVVRTAVDRGTTAELRIPVDGATLSETAVKQVAM
jgi:LytS/YehU family sensor histidine kinase